VTPQDLVLTPTGVRFLDRRFPCSIGRGGLTRDKHEGDGATPVGAHRITGVMYRPDRLAPPNGRAVPIRPLDRWCDDVAAPAYNHLVRAPFTASSETLRRADPLYDVVLTTDYNWPDARPGRGSAIFLHIWRRPHFPTEGCVAFARSNLLWIAARITPATRLIVAGR